VVDDVIMTSHLLTFVCNDLHTEQPIHSIIQRLILLIIIQHTSTRILLCYWWI